MEKIPIHLQNAQAQGTMAELDETLGRKEDELAECKLGAVSLRTAWEKTQSGMKMCCISSCHPAKGRASSWGWCLHQPLLC